MPLKPPAAIELDRKKVEGFLQRAKKALEPDDFVFVAAMVQSLFFLRQLVQEKTRSIGRLLQMLFGVSTESSKNILKDFPREDDGATTDDPTPVRPRPKGHGRNGVSNYPGAQRVHVGHESLKSGDRCPECWRGKVYPVEPGVRMHFFGAAPIQLVIHLLEKLRCNLCGAIFTAQEPPEAGKQKYDATVGAMVGLSRYGNGLPFHRLEQFQANCGIPFSASTQWDIVDESAEHLQPAYEELLRQGAQADRIYQDDTFMRVLSLSKSTKVGEGVADEEDTSRKGVFTTGLVCESEDKTIACFFTGRKHAGENLRDLLKQRLQELGAPIQMCDALSRNMPKDLLTLLANCMSHARRNFVSILDAFPLECRHVIEILAKVYHHDALAKEQNLSPEERLKFHQEKSASLMSELKEWMEAQLRDKLIEPNSGMGQAISYMLKRWDRFTLFLRIPGAPLDNNICERALKMAIRHRKNSLFYRTERGAFVGDLFMTLIHTCNLMGVNAFDYLTTLLRHPEELAKDPSRWMPWNYKEALSQVPP